MGNSMKKLVLYSLSIWALLPLSCTLESDNSGKLGGQWHMEQVDTLATDGHLDMGQQKCYWCFQGPILETSVRDGSFKQQIIYRYAHDNNQLTISEPRLLNREKGDSLLQDTHEFSQFGINDVKETFDIEYLDSHRMTLRSKTLRLFLRKF